MRINILLTFFFLLPVPGKSQWIQIPFPASEELHMVRFVSENTGWVVGSNYIYKTSDGGTSWEAQDSIPPTIFSDVSEALYAIDSNTVMYSDLGRNIIRRTTDGGNTWFDTDTSRYYYGDFKFVNKKLGFAAAGSPDDLDSAFIRKTTNGGETWTTSFSIHAGHAFEGISFVDSLNGWAVRYDGFVYHTTDGGENWMLQDSVGNGGFSAVPSTTDIQFTTKEIGWIVGGLRAQQVLTKTTNGGEEWTNINLNPFSSCSINEVEMLDSKSGWFVGENYSGFVMKTNDSGKTWIDQSPSGSARFHSISMLNDSTGWLVSDVGIYKIGGTVTVPIVHNIINKFWIAQNYPNPFNPVTTIKYNLPNAVFVKIGVFNLIGEELKILENGYKAAGEHTVTFNAAGFSSGVYFYKIESGIFSDIKKLIILR